MVFLFLRGWRHWQLGHVPRSNLIPSTENKTTKKKHKKQRSNPKTLLSHSRFITFLLLLLLFFGVFRRASYVIRFS